MIIRYPIAVGETLFEAIVKAGTIASECGANGYVIVCRRCGFPVSEHEQYGDCDRFVAIPKAEA